MPSRIFADRSDAARHLAAALSTYRAAHPLVLAIPRGGVPIGRVLADALGGELDIVLVPVTHPALGEIRIEESLFAVGRAEAPFASYPAEVAAEIAFIIERGYAADARLNVRHYYLQMKGRARISGRVGGLPVEGSGTGFFETYR